MLPTDNKIEGAVIIFMDIDPGARWPQCDIRLRPGPWGGRNGLV